MRFRLTVFQRFLLVFFGEPDVEVRRPMSMHELQTVNLEFCAAEPVWSFCDIREEQNPILKRFLQTEAWPNENESLVLQRFNQFRLGSTAPCRDSGHFQLN